MRVKSPGQAQKGLATSAYVAILCGIKIGLIFAIAAEVAQVVATITGECQRELALALLQLRALIATKEKILEGKHQD